MIMTAVVRLADHRRKAPYQHFNRPELNLLLALYASRVSRGEWRDYAIHMGADAARFMIFRHSHEHPLFVISKLAPGKTRGKNNRQRPYMVTSRHHRVAQGNTLADVLVVFDRPIRLVSG